MNQHPFGAGLAITTILMVGLVAMAVCLIPAIFYCLTLQKTLKRCSPESRAMSPGLVWLLLVPVINVVWHFMVVLNLAKSLGAEFLKRGIAEEPNPGQKLGLAMCILFCCGIIPVLGIFCSLGAFVCWIIYWIKIAGFSNKIALPAPPVVVPA